MGLNQAVVVARKENFEESQVLFARGEIVTCKSDDLWSRRILGSIFLRGLGYVQYPLMPSKIKHPWSHGKWCKYEISAGGMELDKRKEFAFSTNTYDCVWQGEKTY